MAWKIEDRAGDMERGYPINKDQLKRACESTKEKLNKKK